jgi:hypothetical protein
VRFVQPLRLYLTLSVLFFALLKITNGWEMKASPEARDAVSQQVKQEIDKEFAASKKPEAEPEAESGQDEFYAMLPSAVLPRLKHFEALPSDKKREVFTEGLYHYAPMAMFAMLPLFALYLKVLYLGTGKRYGEHLLFALHTNAFAFAIFTVMLPLNIGFLRFVLWLWVIGYLPWAMRRVYQKGRFGTIWRWLVLMFGYSITMGLGFVGAMAAGILAASH